MLDSEDAALEALRLANPVPHTDAFVPGTESEHDRAQLAAILGGPNQPTTNVVSLAERRRRKLRNVGIAAITGVGLLTTVAWAVIRRSDSVDPVRLVCMNQLRTFDMPTIEANPVQASVIEFKGDPIAACAESWTRPMFEQPAQQPPHLITCVLPSGVLAVMPGAIAQDCEKIGLAQWSGKYRDDPLPLVAMSEELGKWIESNRCAQPDEAVAAARAALDHAKLSKWTVKRDGAPTPPPECSGLGHMSVSIDFTSRVITVTVDPPS